MKNKIVFVFVGIMVFMSCKKENIQQNKNITPQLYQEIGVDTTENNQIVKLYHSSNNIEVGFSSFNFSFSFI